jgi:hypothetical protein
MLRCSIVIQEKIEFSYNLGGSAIYEAIHFRERGLEPTIKFYNHIGIALFSADQGALVRALQM